MNTKKMRGLAAMLVAAVLLLPGLTGCGPKDSGVQAGVRVVGGQENKTPDGGEFETVYVPDIYSFDRPMNFPIRFSTSPNGLYVMDVEEQLYEFDAEGCVLRELGQLQFDWIAPNGTCWRLDGSENKNVPNDRHIDYTVFRVNDGVETQVWSFRTDLGTAELFPTNEQLFITKQYWDDDNTGHFSLEIYDTVGNLLHTQVLSEWFQIYRDGNSIY